MSARGSESGHNYESGFNALRLVGQASGSERSMSDADPADYPEDDNPWFQHGAQPFPESEESDDEDSDATVIDSHEFYYAEAGECMMAFSAIMFVGPFERPHNDLELDMAALYEETISVFMNGVPPNVPSELGGAYPAATPIDGSIVAYAIRMTQLFPLASLRNMAYAARVRDVLDAIKNLKGPEEKSDIVSRVLAVYGERTDFDLPSVFLLQRFARALRMLSLKALHLPREVGGEPPYPFPGMQIHVPSSTARGRYATVTIHCNPLVGYLDAAYDAAGTPSYANNRADFGDITLSGAQQVVGALGARNIYLSDFNAYLPERLEYVASAIFDSAHDTAVLELAPSEFALIKYTLVDAPAISDMFLTGEFNRTPPNDALSESSEGILSSLAAPNAFYYHTLFDTDAKIGAWLKDASIVPIVTLNKVIVRSNIRAWALAAFRFESMQWATMSGDAQVRAIELYPGGFGLVEDANFLGRSAAKKRELRALYPYTVSWTSDDTMYAVDPADIVIFAASDVSAEIRNGLRRNGRVGKNLLVYDDYDGHGDAGFLFAQQRSVNIGDNMAYDNLIAVMASASPARAKRIHQKLYADVVARIRDRVPLIGPMGVSVVGNGDDNPPRTGEKDVQNKCAILWKWNEATDTDGYNDDVDPLPSVVVDARTFRLVVQRSARNWTDRRKVQAASFAISSSYRGQRREVAVSQPVFAALVGLRNRKEEWEPTELAEELARSITTG